MRRTRRKRPLLAVLIVIFFIPFLLGTTANAQNQSGDWAMFRHDPAHTGHADIEGPEQGSVIWSYYTGTSVLSSPAVAGGRVYIGSGVNVYCLNAFEGTLIWKYQTGDSVHSSPAVADGKVYVGSEDSYFYCLDTGDGGLIWRYQTGGYIESSPAVANGRIYIGSSDDYVYCFDPDNGNLIWRSQMGWNVESSPAVAYGKVYLGSWDDYVYCLNETNGNLIWSYETGGDVVSSPAVLAGKVYIGDTLYFYCLDADNGSLIWDYFIGRGVDSSPAVADGKVYVGAEDKHVYCLDANDGSLIWRYQTGSLVESSPAVADGKVYVGSLDEYVYCLSANNGNLIWRRQLGWCIESSPAIFDGKIYIGSWNHYVYCIGAVDIEMWSLVVLPTVPFFAAIVIAIIIGFAVLLRRRPPRTEEPAKKVVFKPEHVPIRNGETPPEGTPLEMGRIRMPNLKTIRSFLKLNMMSAAVFVILFASSFILYEFWDFVMNYDVIHLYPYPIYHGFPLSFWTVWRDGFEPVEPPPSEFLPIHLVIDIVFWYLLSSLIAFCFMKNKEKVKQFLKPDRKKMAIFTLLFILGTIYHEIWYQIWGRNLLGSDPFLLVILIQHGFPLSIWTTIAFSAGVYPYSPSSTEYFLTTLVIDYVFWYLIACLVVLIYYKILKPLYTKKPKNDGSEMSIGKTS